MRAQISTQVFIYILAAVAVAAILLVGSRAVGTILGVFGRANIDDVRNGLTGAVGTISRQYRAVKTHTMNLPEQFTAICFASSQVDGRYPENVRSNPALAEFPLVQDAIQNDDKNNVFLLKEKLIEERFPVEDLVVQGGFLCKNSSGTPISVTLRGTGRTAELSPGG